MDRSKIEAVIDVCISQVAKLLEAGNEYDRDQAAKLVAMASELSSIRLGML